MKFENIYFILFCAFFLLYIYLSLYAFDIIPYKDDYRKVVVVVHRCENDDIWKKYIHVNKDIHCFFRCDMCNTVIEIDSGKIIKEHAECKHTPINTWMK